MLKVHEAAEKLGISKWTLYQMVSKRKIPFVKLGHNMLRFDPTELEIYIDKHRVKPKK